MTNQVLTIEFQKSGVMASMLIYAWDVAAVC